MSSVVLILLLLGASCAPPLLHAADCQAIYDRSKKSINQTADEHLAELRRQADMLKRRLGEEAYRKEVAAVEARRNKELEEAREDYNDCVADEKAQKAKEDEDRAAELNRETEQLEEQIRDIDTDATGRDPAALRQAAERAKAQARERGDLASKQRLAGNSRQAMALENQAAAYRRAASKMESAAGYETTKQRDDARKAKEEAKEQADRQAAKQLDQQTDALRQQSMGFNPYTATGDPAALRQQAEQDRERARLLRDQSWKALSAGNSQQQWALNRQAQELDHRANNLEAAARNAESRSQSEDFQSRLHRQASRAARTGLEDAASGVADEYGSVVRDGLEEAMDLPAVPGRYTGERVREYLESATDRAGTLVPLADTAADYISGSMRREINRHLDSSRNLPPARGGGGYSGPPPPSASRSWSDSPSTEPAAPDYEQTVDDAFEDLREIARQKQAEQQKLNDLLEILRTPVPTTTPSSPDRRYRFDQPTPSASPPPRRYRFDATPTPSGESQDLRSRRNRFD